MIRALIKYTLLLSVILVIASCNSSNDDEFPTGDAPFFVQFTIDQDTIHYQNGVNNYGNGPGRATYEDSIGRLHSEYTAFLRSALEPNYLRNTLTIQSVRFFSDTSLPSFSQRFAMFDLGAYDYGLYTLDSSTAGVDGMVIFYVDADSTIWTTDLTLGSQEAWADFAITSHQASGEELFGGKTQGTFNCRVFNDGGDHLDLRNGSFYARTIYPE